MVDATFSGRSSTCNSLELPVCWKYVVWLGSSLLMYWGLLYIAFSKRECSRLFVRYPSMSLSSTLSRNEKVEQHIRKKTHKPNALRFCVEGGVIPLYVGLLSHSCLSPRCFPPRIFPTSGIRVDGSSLWLAHTSTV